MWFGPPAGGSSERERFSIYCIVSLRFDIRDGPGVAANDGFLGRQRKRNQHDGIGWRQIGLA
jgi:hypothetical protein